MCTLDDKILGEKTHYYCSSSEDEGDDEEPQQHEGQSMPQGPPVDGKRHHTGPKGVISDYEDFKKMEAERRENSEREKLAQAKKSCISVKPYSPEDDSMLDDDGLWDECDDTEFLETYRQKRMAEMAEKFKKVNSTSRRKFGSMVKLTQATFVDAVDKEEPLVSVVVLISDSVLRECVSMETAFQELATDYLFVKFCFIHTKEIGTSIKFNMEALPTILVYKGGELIGNFIRLSEEFGEDVCASDLEGFLRDNGMLSCDEMLSLEDAARGGAAVGGWRQGEGDTDSDDD